MQANQKYSHKGTMTNVNKPTKLRKPKMKKHKLKSAHTQGALEPKGVKQAPLYHGSWHCQSRHARLSTRLFFIEPGDTHVKNR
jgi:hypothetical protein